MTSAIAGLKNRRIFFLGVNTGYVRDGKPDSRFLDFYASRSSPDLYCSIVGNVVVPGGYGVNAVSPVLTRDSAWANLAAVIRDGGALAGVQLSSVWEGYSGAKKFVSINTSEVIDELRQVVASLGQKRISVFLDAFEAGASAAACHGFGHIQFHAAHGYLLNLLIDRRLNPCAAWVMERLIELLGQLRRSGVETSVRISLKSGDPIFDSQGSDEFHDEVVALPFDYVDLSFGFYNIDKRMIYPALPRIIASRFNDSVALASRHPGRAFIISGRAMQYDWRLLPSNIHLGLCRDLIANPNFLQEPRNGCQNRSKCHYYSRGSGRLTCALWGK